MFDKSLLKLLSFILITVTLADTVRGLELNQDCVINRTQRGICMIETLCEKPCASKDEPLQLCRRRGKVSTVCCPKDRPTQSISAQKCLEYKQLVCNLDNSDDGKASACAIPMKYVNGEDPSIANGVAASKNEFPHMAQILLADDSKYVCGGILISDQFVLTSAHCLSNATIQVRLGEYNTTDKENTDRIDLNVATIYQHPNYSSCHGYDDIALIKLDKPVTFTKAIRPACLPEERISNDIVNATATGWGLTESGPYSNILMKVNLDMLDDDKCKSWPRIYPDGVKRKAQFCAGSTNTGNTCSGDSGGPIQVWHESHYCTFTIIGVTGFGGGCDPNVDRTSGIYARVHHYLDWIEGIVWPTSPVSVARTRGFSRNEC